MPSRVQNRKGYAKPCSHTLPSTPTDFHSFLTHTHAFSAHSHQLRLISSPHPPTHTLFLRVLRVYRLYALICLRYLINLRVYVFAPPILRSEVKKNFLRIINNNKNTFFSLKSIFNAQDYLLFNYLFLSNWKCSLNLLFRCIFKKKSIFQRLKYLFTDL